MKNLNIALFGLSIIMITSCNLRENSPAAPSQQSSSGAKTVNVGKQFNIPVNAEGNTIEQQNIIDKNKITSDPTRVMWMHLIDYQGRMYMRTPVRGKITSSTKRLEPITCAAGMSNGQGVDVYYGARTADNQHVTTELIQIDGTYSNSDPYVFWFDPMGNYFQKGDGYLLSSIPIDLSNPTDKISGLYNADKAAQEWQKSIKK